MSLNLNEVLFWHAHSPEDLNKLKDQFLLAIEKCKQQEEALLAQPSSWEKFIKPFEANNEELKTYAKIVDAINYGFSSPYTRELSSICRNALEEYFTLLFSNEQIVYKYSEVLQEDPSLDALQKKSIDCFLKDYRTNGIFVSSYSKSNYVKIKKFNLFVSPHDKKKFAERQIALLNLETKFSENIEDSIEKWNTENSDLDLRHAHLLLKRLDSQEDRKRLYFGSQGIGNNQPLDNRDIIHEILTLRQQIAYEKKHKSFAHMAISCSEAKHVSRVKKFLAKIVRNSQASGKKILTSVMNFAQEKYGVEQLEPCDILYYQELLLKDRHPVLQKNIKFDLQDVIQGLQKLVRVIFDIELVEEKRKIDGSILDQHLIWHVKYGENHMGTILADLFSRSKKGGGAHVSPCGNRHVKADGSLSMPWVFLCCNFYQDGSTALIDHNDLIVFTHELGHALHHIISNINYPCIAGFGGVDIDAIEVPSQFMENFCLQPSSLKMIVNDVISIEDCSDLIKAHTQYSCLQEFRTSRYSLLDIAVHEARPEKFPLVEEGIMRKYSVVEEFLPSKPLSSFSHLFSDDYYASSYYSYLWAEKKSDLIFKYFEKKGVLDSSVGKSFVDNILSKGGSENMEVLMKNFCLQNK